MTDAVSKRRLIFRPGRRTTILAVILLALLGLAAWAVTHHSRVAPPELPHERMARQVREHGGPGAELRYAEPGLRRAVCGYIGRGAEGAAVGFVSTPNRILFSDDPLPKEFAQLRARYCPGFLAPPPRGRS